MYWLTHLAYSGMRGVWETRRPHTWSLVVLIVMALTACSAPEKRSLPFASPPQTSWITKSGHEGVYATPVPSQETLAKPLVTLAMQGCSLKNRFDRSSTFAYNFANDQSRLEFNLRVKGPSLSDPGRLDFQGVGFRFTHKFQKIKTPQEKCRFDSPFQGLIGSAYNEFIERQNDTVMEELRLKVKQFW